MEITTDTSNARRAVPQLPYLGGVWAATGAARQMTDVLNPSSGQVIATVPLADRSDADRAVASAVAQHEAGTWSSLSFAERAAYLDRLADAIEQSAATFGDYYVDNEANNISRSTSVIQLSVAVLRDVARIGRQFISVDERSGVPGSRVLINRLPVGPVLAAVPWNAPLILSVTKIGPALLAGCPVVLKSDLKAPLTGYLLTALIHELGLPAGTFSHLVASTDVSKYLVDLPGTAHVSFTGSTAVGQQVAAASAKRLRRTTLELGGKGAGIILADIDPADAMTAIVSASLGHAGQTCTTASRLLVPAQRYDEWKAALTATFESLTIGDTRDPAFDLGPLISAAHRDHVKSFVDEARAGGATILTGGDRPDHLVGGFFFRPTLISDVVPGMRVLTEEVFGPVTTLQAYGSVDEAITMANDTQYGLANFIFTHDLDLGTSLACRLRSGTVGINRPGSVMTQPVGGMALSGIGREGGLEGIEEFLELQQVHMPG